MTSDPAWTSVPSPAYARVVPPTVAVAFWRFASIAPACVPRASAVAPSVDHASAVSVPETSTSESEPLTPVMPAGAPRNASMVPVVCAVGTTPPPPARPMLKVNAVEVAW